MSSKIVFLGNSLTAGHHRAAYLPRVRSMLASRLGAEAPECVNAGMGGDTMANLLRRAPSAVHPHDPQRVVIQSGLNDVITAWLPTQRAPRAAEVLETFFRRTKRAVLPMSVPVFEGIVRDLVHEIRRHRAVPISVCTLTLMGEDPGQDCSLLAEEYDTALRGVAWAEGCDVIDVHAAFREGLRGETPRRFELEEVDFTGLPDDASADALARERGFRFVYDGLHLSTRGADLMASVVAEHLVSGVSG